MKGLDALKNLNTEKIECAICGKKAHFLEAHIKSAHGMDAKEYQEKHGKAPLLSEAAQWRLQEIARPYRNELIEYDIEKTFGIKIASKIKKVKGFAAPHPTTPTVDPHYKFRAEQLTAILFERDDPQGEKVLFTGPTGSGKTSALEQFAARLNLPFFRINMDADITRADFVGQWVLKCEEMEFMYGFLPRALSTPYAVMVIDEWDCMNPSNAMALQAVLEGKPLAIAETAEMVTPKEGVSLFCTANTIGQGDETGLYVGTQVQNFAQLDRFTIVLKVDYPDAQVEADILRAKCHLTDEELLERWGVKETKDSADQYVKKFLEVARLVRDAFKKEEIAATMSTRTLVNIANKTFAFGNINTAYAMAYTNKLSGADRDFVNEIVQRVWG